MDQLSKFYSYFCDKPLTITKKQIAMTSSPSSTGSMGDEKFVQKRTSRKTATSIVTVPTAMTTTTTTADSHSNGSFNTETNTRDNNINAANIITMMSPLRNKSLPVSKTNTIATMKKPINDNDIDASTCTVNDKCITPNNDMSPNNNSSTNNKDQKQPSVTDQKIINSVKNDHTNNDPIQLQQQQYKDMIEHYKPMYQKLPKFDKGRSSIISTIMDQCHLNTNDRDSRLRINMALLYCNSKNTTNSNNKQTSSSTTITGTNNSSTLDHGNNSTSNMVSDDSTIATTGGSSKQTSPSSCTVSAGNSNNSKKSRKRKECSNDDDNSTAFIQQQPSTKLAQSSVGGTTTATNQPDDNADMNAWKTTILPILQYCGTCAQCTREPCMKCRLCKHHQTNTTKITTTALKKDRKMRQYCLLKCCGTFDTAIIKKCKKGLEKDTAKSKSTASSKNESAKNIDITKGRERYMIYQWYRNEMTYTIRYVEQEEIMVQHPSGYRFDVGMIVNCLWPATQTYYEAEITHRYHAPHARSNLKYVFYSVHFLDGSDDTRIRVPEREILTLFHMDLLVEADRIEDKVNEFTRLLLPEKVSKSVQVENSTSNDVADANHDVCTRNITFETSTSVSSTSLDDGTYSAASIACENTLLGSNAHQGSNSDDLCIGSRCCFRFPNKECPFQYLGTIVKIHVPKRYVILPDDRKLPKEITLHTDDVVSAAKFFPQGIGAPSQPASDVIIDDTSSLAIPSEQGTQDQSSDTIDLRSPLKMKYSSKKQVGSRCYARWSQNGLYFWGYITKTHGSGPRRRYTVRFDDGDVCDNILPEHVFSEKEYKKIERKDPPPIPTPSQGAQCLTSHTLYDMGFCRKWIDVKGSTITTFGKIGQCFEAFDDPSSVLFEIKYFDDNLSYLGKNDSVSEKVAWGGYLMYLKETEPRPYSPPPDVPFHVKWIVPDRRYYDRDGRLTMEIRGYRLQMTAEQSTIRGAGLGLMLRISDISGRCRSTFVLPKGELLCLGPYGPFRTVDRKAHALFEIKSFIHEYEPESYCFESRYEGRDIFVDITNDDDGKLHDLAKASLMCRVNEISEGDIPSVCADRDPSGGIHYYLGHDIDEYDDLKINVGSPFELKVDYGDLYERQRVRFGYPRISGDELIAMTKSIETLDADTIQDISEYYPGDLYDCVLFVESLFCPQWNAATVKKLRALLVVLNLRKMIMKFASIGDLAICTTDGTLQNDVNREAQLQMLLRTKQLIKKLCDSVCDSHQESFKENLQMYELLKKEIVQAFCDESVAVFSAMSSRDLYMRIVSAD